jgi:hypothetical protein
MARRSFAGGPPGYARAPSVGWAETLSSYEPDFTGAHHRAGDDERGQAKGRALRPERPGAGIAAKGTRTRQTEQLSIRRPKPAAARVVSRAPAFKPTVNVVINADVRRPSHSRH